MELVEVDVLTDELRSQLEGDEQDPWDSARIPPLQWRAKQQHFALRDDRGRLVASAGVLVAEVEAGGDRFPVVGVGGVIVNQAFRGHGLSLRVIEAALAKAATLGPPLALLFCHEDRMGLYGRFGFEEVPEPVLIEHDGDRIAMPMRAMWRALTAGARWPEGQAVLRGRPF